jgi:hypothetical protein
MPLASLYVYFFVGILLSVLVPIGMRWIVEARDPIPHGPVWDRIVAFATPYIKVSIGSAILGFLLILLFLQGGGKPEELKWFNAILYGYAWDSTVQKFRQALKGQA